MGAPPLLDAFVLVVFVTPLIVIGAVWRSKRRANRDGTLGTVWASAGLVLVRVGAAFYVVLYLITLVSPSGTSFGVGDRVTIENGWFDSDVERGDGYRLTVSMLTTQPALQLCPEHGVPYPGRPGVTRTVERNCWARRNLAKNVGGVDVGAWTMTKKLVDPPRVVVWKVKGLQVVGLVGLGLIALALERVLRLVTLRQPFAAANATWFRVLAAGVATLCIVYPVLAGRFADGVVRDYLGEPGRLALGMKDAPVGIAPFFVVIMLLALAEVWRFGIRLQEEAEATV